VDLQSQYKPQGKEELAVMVVLCVESLPWRVHVISSDKAVMWGEWRQLGKGAATTWAENITKKLGVPECLHPRLASSMKNEVNTKVIYLAVPTLALLNESETSTQAGCWVPWEDIQLRETWTVAAMAVAAHQQPTAEQDVLIPLEIQIQAAMGDGVVPRSRVFRKELIPTGDNTEWRSGLMRAEVAQMRMSKRLRDIPNDDPDADWLHHCADVMKPIPVREIPQDLQKKLPSFEQEELATLEFPTHPAMPTTEWLKPPVFKHIPRQLWPKSYGGFWKPDFFAQGAAGP
jgi:hypothetical protein